MNRSKVLRTFALSSVLLIMLCGCGKSKDNAENTTTTASVVDSASDDFPSSDEMLADKFKGVTASSFGPKLKISDTKVKAGEIAEVTLSVSETNESWNACGLHLTFPSELKCVHKSADTQDVKFRLGDASEGSGGSIALEWEENLPEELTSKGLGSIFFTTIFAENGFDGDIATFYFEVPQDAQPGTVYPFGFYYLTNDIFKSVDGDDAYQLFAFTNWQGGTVTVE